jgi:hypothetical protein
VIGWSSTRREGVHLGTWVSVSPDNSDAIRAGLIHRQQFRHSTLTYSREISLWVATLSRILTLRTKKASLLLQVVESGEEIVDQAEQPLSGARRRLSDRTPASGRSCRNSEAHLLGRRGDCGPVGPGPTETKGCRACTRRPGEVMMHPIPQTKNRINSSAPAGFAPRKLSRCLLS